MYIFSKSFSKNAEEEKYKDKLSIFEKIPISLRKAMPKSYNKDIADYADYLYGDKSKEKGYKRFRNVKTGAGAVLGALVGSAGGPLGTIAGAGAGAGFERYAAPFLTKHVSSKFAKARVLDELESDRRKVAAGIMPYKEYYKKYHKFDKD